MRGPWVPRGRARPLAGASGKVMRKTARRTRPWGWAVKDEEEFARLCVRGRERKVEEKEKNWDLSFASSILRRKETFCGCFLTKPS